MKKSLIIPLLALTPIFAHSEPANEAIIGSFEIKMSNPGNSLYIQLDCKSDVSCTLTTTSQQGSNQPTTDKQSLNQITHLQNLTEANYALKYAIEQQSNTIKSKEFSEPMEKLRPVLSTNPSIEKCWDLNYPSPTYMLACSLNGNSSNKYNLYLFGALLSNCGEAYCRYVIYPMTRLK